MIYARYIEETGRWALLANPDDEESLFHLESDGTIWMVGHGHRAMADARQSSVALPGIVEVSEIRP